MWVQKPNIKKQPELQTYWLLIGTHKELIKNHKLLFFRYGVFVYLYIIKRTHHKAVFVRPSI